jgi:hypothetical protein
MSTIRTIEVPYGHLPERISRKQAERFIHAHNAKNDMLPIPRSPIARFWCRKAPVGAPGEWVIGWTGPVVVREEEIKAANDERLIKFSTHESSARGALVT